MQPDTPADPEVPAGLAHALADRYRILREVGAGGMATVYLAEDLRHRRNVAIKVLSPHLAQGLGPERFLREIEIAAGLTHPHILSLHDSGDADGSLYYVMPFVDGESLEDRLRREAPLPPEDAVRIWREIVDGLGEAHGRGIVHRDVKPANVLIAGGHALVADFGIAKAVSDANADRQLTATGTSLGTPEYMAPEQASGEAATDQRADLFAAGAIAYEMLTGASPFAAETPYAVYAALMANTPDTPHTVRDAVPEALSDVVMWCLEKDPDRRPQTAAELLERLDAAWSTTRAGSVPAPARHGRSRAAGGGGRGRLKLHVWLPVVAVGAALALGGWRWTERRALERWAQEEGIPEVLALQGANRMAEAAVLAAEIEAILGPQPVLEPIWPLMSTPLRITTDPPGATATYRPYVSDVADWQPLGVTPYEAERFPVGAFRFRIELEGFERIEKVRSFIPDGQRREVLMAGAGYDYMQDASYVVDATLDPVGSLPDGMIAVGGGLYGTTPVLGFGGLDPRPAPRYLIDRTEVTNRAYQEFVDAGGYGEAGNWAEAFLRDGTELGWQAAMEAFLDSTDRPGPATWILGQPPAGEEDHPVSGVSWFEANAYCRWRRKSLPTLFHWARAALPSTDFWIAFNPLLAGASNFDGDGPEPVGTRHAIGISGAQDIAGNVREWVTTGGGDGLRYLMGGAWSDPLYYLHDSYPTSPWQRAETDGFRCAVFPEGEAPEHLRVAADFPEQDFSGEGSDAVMSDGEFRARQRFHAYDRSLPLADTVELRTQLDWGATREWVSIDAAYGDERLPIRIHLPTDVEPPYEAFIFFGGGNVIRSRAIEDPQPPVDYLVRSGRALIEPIYEGTFQRNGGRTVQRLGGEGSAELFAHWVQDIGRTIDYLETRPDIDADRISFFGLSLGAVLMPYLVPYEPRFKAAILYSGGFTPTQRQGSIDPLIAHLRRVTIPVLQLGGTQDFNHPVEPFQQEFFRHLVTPAEDKHQQFFDAAHQPLPLTPVVQRSVEFLEQYVGGGGR